MRSPANVPPSVIYAARRDQSYFRENLSPEVRRIYELLEEILDPMEYDGSFLFDEYPDVGEILRLTDLVLRRVWEMKEPNAPGPEAEADGDQARERELVKALLCEEMCRRRFRHSMRRAAI